MRNRVSHTIRERASRGRSGFTLLEVILATSIAMLLLWGVYTSINVQLNYTQQGRDVTEQSSLARSLFTRIANDVEPSIGLPDPGLFRAKEEEGAAPGGTTGGTTNGTTEEDILADDVGTTRVLAVQGDTTMLRLYVSRVPREAYVERNTLEEQPEDAEDAEGDGNPEQIVSDQREIVYWLVEEGRETGLARQEVRRVTADFESVPIAMGQSDESKHIIAEEVRSVSFAYWDGTAWFDEWDGNELGADGVTPKGPPLAIEVLITMEFPGPTLDHDPVQRTYRHVIHIPTANGPVPEIEGEETVP